MSGIAGLAALIAGIALAVWAADVLVDGLLGVARALRVAPFALTVALSGFELENVVAGIAANAGGLPDAAIGTVLGGATFLALGVAGLGAVIAPMRVDLPPRFAAWTAVAAVPLLVLALDGRLSRADGALLVAWFAVVLVGLVRSGRELLDRTEDERTTRPALRLLVGLAALTGAGWLLGEGLRGTVRGLGLSEALLGNTALAASVEAEEVARVAVPARRGRPELGLATIVGSIAHFVTLNAGVIALVRPLDLGRETTSFYLPAAAAGPVVLALLLLARRRLGRRDGAALLVLYLGYVGAAVAVST